MTININGRPVDVYQTDISYAEIVALAFPGSHPDHSVTFARAAGDKREGILTAGQSVAVKDGTIFNVARTGAA